MSEYNQFINSLQYLSQFNDDLTLEYLRGIRKSNRNNLDIQEQYAITLINLGNFTEAYDLLVTIGNKDINRFNRHTFLIRRYRNLEAWNAVICLCKAWIHIKPTLKCFLRSDLILSLAASGRIKEALIEYHEGINDLEDPEYDEGINEALHRGLRISNKEDVVLKLYFSQLHDDPNNSSARYNAIILLKNMGNIDIANDLLNVGLQIDPDNIYFLLEKGATLIDNGNMDDVIVIAEKISNLHSSDSRIFQDAAYLLVSADMYYRAINIIREGIAQYPDDPNLHKDLAVILKSIGQVDDAIHEYKASITIEPGYIDPYVELGSLFIDRNDIDTAKYYIEEAIKRFKKRSVLEYNPVVGSAYRQYSLIMKEMNNINQSIKYMKKAIQKQPDNGIWHLELGDVYVDLGKIESAQNEWKLAIEYGDQNTVKEALSRLNISFNTILNEIIIDSKKT